MKALVLGLFIFSLLSASPAQAQWDDLGGDDGRCACGYQFASTCCGCGLAKPIRGYDCINTCAPDGCCCSSQCTWEDWGACTPTSNSACQCAPSPLHCGDGICNNGEDCTSCSRDCGSCSGGSNPNPPPTNTCARCETGISNCGERGLDPADGTCSAGLCCKDKGQWTYGNCCDDQNWGPPGWSSCWDAARNGWTDASGNDAYTYGAYAAARGECGSCTTSCPAAGPFCGSPNGCGGSCPSTDTGAPTIPVFTTPSASNEMLKTDGDSKLTLSWNSVAKAERYEVEIYASDTLFTAPSEGSLIVSSAPLIATSFTFTPANRYFAARVRALNSTCSSEYSSWSGFAYFQAAVPVTGQVFYDPSGRASLIGLPGTLCTGPTSPLPSAAGAVSVSGANNEPTALSYPNSAVASPAYSLRLPFSPVGSPGTNRVGLNISNSEWSCTCPAGCQYNYSLQAPLSGVNFYLSPTSGPWFQVEGGPIGAFGEAGRRVLSNNISEFCTPPTCSPYLIVNQNGGDSEGYVLTGGGYVVGTDNIDESGHNWVAKMSSAPERRQDYRYFKNLALLPTSPKSDFSPFGKTLEGTITSLTKPDKGQAVINPAPAQAYFHDGEAVIDTPWSIESDEKIVLLVDGDIAIEEPITVETGGFFMLVVSGDITFDASLGTDDLNQTEALVEGIFVADGLLTVESTETGGDKRFIGEGTFVGWGGVKLERDYDDGAGRRALNNVSAVEYIRYRPDFITAAPEEFMRSRYSWQQVNP